MAPSYQYLVVGAGFSGAVVARELALHTEAKVLVVDERPHIAGNCHTSRDEATGVMVHRYGPHIFNTSNEAVWKYVQQFARFGPYIHRVKADTERGVFGLPINLLTINQFFGQHLSPAEAKLFLATLSEPVERPVNFEEQALKLVGRELYEAFFYGYTKKQWGCEPREIPASVLQRLPVRFNYDDNYYDSKFQGIPEEGYSALIANILHHPRIEVQLNHRFTPAEATEFDHVFYTGPIDTYFGHRLGRLGYRTVQFERMEEAGDLQGCAQINYPSFKVPFTRVSEHKHFAPWEDHARTVAFKEFSKQTEAGDEPYYPIRRAEDKTLLESYYELARQESKVSFLGRLGTYRYLDMDEVIGEALLFSEAFLRALAEQTPTGLPRFSYVPPPRS